MLHFPLSPIHFRCVSHAKREGGGPDPGTPTWVSAKLNIMLAALAHL